MTRRMLLLCAVLAALMSSGAASASAATITSDFRFVTGSLIAADIECDTSVYYVCGVGTFDDQAAVTRVEYPTNQRLLLDQGCALYETVEVITLRDGSGELRLEHVDALVCGPSPQWLLHASTNSFGNPFRVTSEWTVAGGSGVYEGATGSGTWEVRWSGGAGFGGHNGTVTVP
jgi:hypothetical protein